MQKCVTILGLSFLLAITLSGRIIQAQNDEDKIRIVPEIKAYRINPHPPKIDGDLSDPIWQSPHLEITTSFTQRQPDDGSLPTDSTRAAVAFDDDALYVAFWCYDSEPEKIDAQLVRRDRDAQSDRVTFRVDPFHDHQTGNAFEVSAAGVQRDCRYYNENNADMSWDAVWESGVTRQPWGWSAEMRIPFCCLRFSEGDDHPWGVDFIRRINRKDEQLRWAYTPLSEGRFVANFGHLTGISNIGSGNHLEFLPYIVSSVQTEPRDITNTDGRSYLSNAGFDFKYALSSDLILDATINPDFGQVELDRPVLNLSTYETFFPEKRAFFLEGSDLFETEFNLFYSRRIGRSPQGEIDDDEQIYAINAPSASTILGATKLTGKLKNGTSIAFLTALTQEESTEYEAMTNLVLDSNLVGSEWQIDTLSADTVTRSTVVEPRANYTVLRIKQDVLNNSSVGGILTLASQEGSHPATTGGIDWRLHTNDGAWVFRGQAIFSRVDNLDVGHGLDMTIEKAAGEHIRGAVGGLIKSPELRLNRLGYSSRSDRRFAWGWLQYRTDDDWWIVRNSWNNFNFYTSWNFAGVNYQLGGNYNFYIDFTNYWSLGGGFEIQGEKYSDEETRDNGLWQWPETPTYSWWSNLRTDQRRKVNFTWNPGGGTDRGGSWWANYIGVDVRPRSNMEFSLGANYSRSIDQTRWVENDNDSSVFAEFNRDQVSLQGSIGFVASRNLSFQLSAEGLVSGLDYEHYRYYLGGNNYGNELSGYDSDYNYSALNSTFLIRWEYHPGSTLYAVWTRARSQSDDSLNNLDLSRDINRLFSGGAENIFLLKTSYWLNI